VRAASPIPAHIIAREEKKKAEKEAEEARQLKERQKQYYAQEAANRAARWANQNERVRRMAHMGNLRTLQERIRIANQGIKGQGNNPGMLGNSYVGEYKKTIANAQRKIGEIYDEYGVNHHHRR